MEKKGLNRLFLCIILLHIAVVFLLVFANGRIKLGIVENFFFSEMIIWLPALIYLLIRKKKNGKNCAEPEEMKIKQEGLASRLGFRKIKISSLLMVVLFTFLMMPLTTLLNAVSMLFVDNTVLQLSPQMLNMPFLLMFFFIAIYAPFCEEFVFRGIIFKGYRKEGSALYAILLSGLLFGLMHLNFNQAGYAFVMGIALALLVEVSGNIFSSILCHLIFNAQSVSLLYLEQHFFPGLLEEQMQMDISNEQMYITISFYLLIAAVTTAIAVCVLHWIAKNEGNEQCFQNLFHNRKKGNTLISPALILGILLSIAYMIFSIHDI